MKCQSALASAMNYAMQKKLITINPTWGSRKNESFAVPVKYYDTLSIEQIHRTYDYIKNSPREYHYFEYFFTVLHSAARRNEVLGLRWMDVNLITHEAKIRHQLYPLGNQQYDLIKVKTPSSNGIVILTPENAEVLQEYLNAQSIYDKDGTRVLPKRDDLIFRRNVKESRESGELGSFLLPNAVSKAWKRITHGVNAIFEEERKSGISDIPPISDKLEKIQVRLHDLRHTHASLLYAEGADDFAISKRLRHSKTSTTQQIYMHQTKESSTRVAQTFSDALSGRRNNGNYRN
jgi:integrase